MSRWAASSSPIREEVFEVDEEQHDRRHRVPNDDPAVGLEPLFDLDVVADIEVARDFQLPADVDALADIGVLPDEYVFRDVTPHVESAVAVGLDRTAKLGALARQYVSAADAELDGRTAAHEDVPVRYEVALLGFRPVGNDEFVERIPAEGHIRIQREYRLINLARRQSFV